MLNSRSRSLFIIFVVIIMLFTFVGCNNADNNIFEYKDGALKGESQPTPDVTIQNDDTLNVGQQTPDVTIQNDDTRIEESQKIPDVTIQNDETRIEESQQTPDVTSQNNVTAIFRADTYIQDASLSGVYSFEVMTKNGEIYIGDTLYKKTTSSVPPIISEDDNIFVEAAYLDEDNGNHEFTDTLNKIKDSETCYLLETSQSGKTGEKIYVYEIGDAYYFVTLFDNGMIMRVHRANIALGL